MWWLILSILLLLLLPHIAIKYYCTTPLIYVTPILSPPYFLLPSTAATCNYVYLYTALHAQAAFGAFTPAIWCKPAWYPPNPPIVPPPMLRLLGLAFANLFINCVSERLVGGNPRVGEGVIMLLPCRLDVLPMMDEMLLQKMTDTLLMLMCNKFITVYSITSFSSRIHKLW